MMERPCRRDVTRPAWLSCARWKESVVAGTPTRSPIWPAGRPAGPRRAARAPRGALLRPARNHAHDPPLVAAKDDDRGGHPDGSVGEPALEVVDPGDGVAAEADGSIPRGGPPGLGGPPRLDREDTHGGVRRQALAPRNATGDRRRP